MIRFYLHRFEKSNGSFLPVPPKRLQPLLIKDFLQEYTKASWGECLGQELVLPDCSCQIYHIYRKGKGPLYVGPGVNQFALECILEGDLSADMDSGVSVQLGNEYTYFMYLPAEVEQRANFPAAPVISIHINYSIDFLRRHVRVYPFMADFIRQYEANPTVSLSLGPVANDFPMKKAWRRFYDELQTHPNPARMVAVMAHELLVKFCELHEKNINASSKVPAGVKHPAQIKMVRTIIEKDFKSKHLYRDLRAAVGLNEYAMKTEFKLMYGISIHQMVMELKYDYAYKEILSTTKNIRDIMHEVGYVNFSNFSKVFKRRFGVVPSKTRINTDTD